MAADPGLLTAIGAAATTLAAALLGRTQVADLAKRIDKLELLGGRIDEFGKRLDSFERASQVAAEAEEKQALRNELAGLAAELKRLRPAGRNSNG